MTWTGTYDHGNDTDVTYAKPRPHSATGTWATDVVAEAANADDGRQRSFASLADSTEYSVFKQAGGSPVSTDTVLAVMEAGVNDIDVDGYSQQEALRIMLAAMAGGVAGAGTTTNTIQAADGSKARITATVDTNGNRSSLTLDGS